MACQADSVVVCVKYVCEDVVGVGGGFHGVEESRTAVQRHELEAQFGEIAEFRRRQGTPTGLPCLDRVLLEAEVCGERLLGDSERLPDELEHVPGDEPTAGVPVSAGPSIAL